MLETEKKEKHPRGGHISLAEETPQWDGSAATCGLESATTHVRKKAVLLHRGMKEKVGACEREVCM